MQYRIYFEFYGNKKQTVIEAQSIEDAKDQIKDKIIFHKVVKEEDFDFVEYLKNMFGTK